MAESLLINKGLLQTKEEAVKDLVSSVNRLVKSDYFSAADDDDDEASSIVGRVKDFLKMIPIDNKKKAKEHLVIFCKYGAARALLSLYNSSIKSYKEIGEESIGLFLYPEIKNLGDQSIQNQCALVIRQFSRLIRANSADYNDQPLYLSCRETLGYLLKSMGFRNRLRYFGAYYTSHLIQDLYPFVMELYHKESEGLSEIWKSSSMSVTCSRLRFESDIREFNLFSLHMRRAIEDHFKSEGQSLPVCLDENFNEEEHPCYMDEVKWFHGVFRDLLLDIDLCMRLMERDIRKAGVWELNQGWSYYLSILKELNNISELYQGAEERLSSVMRLNPISMGVLVMHSKRSDDHQWLLKHKDVIDFETRTHLMMMMLFPEVKDDNEKRHKMLIDRSQLLKESFEHITHADPKSLRNGLFVEFKNEVSTGHGVLREWLSLVCQALFDPQNSLFLACPHDRRRFFPDPAKKDPHHLNYFGFCGQMIALALMHEVQVGIAFDRVFFLQLAGEEISLEDIRYADPILYNSCKKILEMDADFMDSDAMGLTFVNEIEEFGSRKVVELCPGGNTIVVNSKNREEYIHQLIQHCFVKSISEQVASFARGFGDFFAKRRLQKMFFRSFELKDLDHMLLGSDRNICVKDWKAHTYYEDYKNTDDQICWFWKVIEGMSSEQQRELLFFWTSLKYLPLNGFSGLPSRLCIYKSSGSHYHLPSSHTCFYRLSLPQYPSLAVMQQHLLFICKEKLGRSFGFL